MKSIKEKEKGRIKEGGDEVSMFVFVFGLEGATTRRAKGSGWEEEREEEEGEKEKEEGLLRGHGCSLNTCVVRFVVHF